MYRPTQHRAFTLIEMLIVVALIAVLAAAIVPQFTDSTSDARASTAQFNLNVLRAQIELYRAEHGGANPNATLGDLLVSSTYKGRTVGPYLNAMAENPLTGSQAVKNSTGPKIVVGDITPGGGGWVYSPATGEVRLDHLDHWWR